MIPLSCGHEQDAAQGRKRQPLLQALQQPAWLTRSLKALGFLLLQPTHDKLLNEVIDRDSLFQCLGLEHLLCALGDANNKLRPLSDSLRSIAMSLDHDAAVLHARRTCNVCIAL